MEVVSWLFVYLHHLLAVFFSFTGDLCSDVILFLTFSLYGGIASNIE